MDMNDRQKWKEFQSKMRQSGATTVSATRALLVQDYIDQERQRKEEGRFSKSEDDEADAIIRDAISKRGSMHFGTSLSSLEEDSVNISARSRRESIASFSTAEDDQSQEHGSTRRNLYASGRSLSGRQQDRRGPVSGSQRHLNMSSFSLKQSTRVLSMEEKARRQASTKRKEGFDTMVNGMLGNEKAKPKHTRRGSVASLLNISQEIRHVASRERRASADVAFTTPWQQRGSTGSLNTLSSQSRTSSCGGVVVEDTQHLSASLSTFADDDDDDEEGANITETTINRKVSTPALTVVSARLSCKEPVEIDTDGKVKMLSVNEEKLLVDFPSRDPVVPRFRQLATKIKKSILITNKVKKPPCRQHPRKDR